MTLSEQLCPSPVIITFDAFLVVLIDIVGIRTTCLPRTVVKGQTHRTCIRHELILSLSHASPRTAWSDCGVN